MSRRGGARAMAARGVGRGPGRAAETERANQRLNRCGFAALGARLPPGRGRAGAPIGLGALPIGPASTPKARPRWSGQG